MNITVLCGGIGAAKLLQGFQLLVKEKQDVNVTAIVNTADDDYFYGFRVCPDLDSIVYHLSELHDEQRGWGRKNETFNFVNSLKEFGIDAWFNLGDKDLALNKFRTDKLNQGNSLTQATFEICSALDISSINILPMTDSKVSTRINTKEISNLSMQEYFVKHGCKPSVTDIKYTNCPETTTIQVNKALSESDRVIIAPSNPYLSIFPILEIKEINDYLIENREKVWAVSPIVSNKSVKGPLSKILQELGEDVSWQSISSLYSDYAANFVAHVDDLTKQTEQLDNVTIHSFDIMMTDPNIKLKLAQFLSKESVS